ncbi:hypothetical protein L7F22_005304 [Adiantum nelumboides]|nr:hypothetical protein [Adiantum nelumboides]
MDSPLPLASGPPCVMRLPSSALYLPRSLPLLLQDLQWVFGVSSDVRGGIADLRTCTNKSRIAYVAGHTLVIYDRSQHRQIFLQGHVHRINCLCACPKKKYIVSADCGPDAILIVWNYETGQVHSSISQKETRGIVAIDFLKDNGFATLSDTGKNRTQTLCIWNIETTSCKLVTSLSAFFADVQHCLQTNKNNQDEFVTNGKETVFFWSLLKEESANNSVSRFLGRQQAMIKTAEMEKSIHELTLSSFLPSSDAAITGMTSGEVIFWQEPRSPFYKEQSKPFSPVTDKEECKKEPSARRMYAIKIIRLHHTPITHLSVQDRYLVTGGSDGYIRFYDCQLGLVGWFEELKAGEITSISFSAMEENKQEGTGVTLLVPPFVVGTKKGHVVLLHAAIFEEPPGSLHHKGEALLDFVPKMVKCVSAHPRLPHFAIINADGLLQVHDYNTRRLCLQREFSKLRAETIAYSPSGSVFACGFFNGFLKIIDADLLKDVENIAISRSGITKLDFACDESLLAVADASFAVSLVSCFISEITERINDVSFRLRQPDTWKIHNAFHVSRLKPFKGDVPDEQPEVEENEEILIPEQILAHKDAKNKEPARIHTSKDQSDYCEHHSSTINLITVNTFPQPSLATHVVNPQQVGEPTGILTRAQRAALGLNLPTGPSPPSPLPHCDLTDEPFIGAKSRPTSMLSDIDGAFLEVVAYLQQVKVQAEAPIERAIPTAEAILKNTFQQVSLYDMLQLDVNLRNDTLLVIQSLYPGAGPSGGHLPVQPSESYMISYPTAPLTVLHDEDLLQWLEATTLMLCYVVSIQALPEDTPSFPATQAEQYDPSRIEEKEEESDHSSQDVTEIRLPVKPVLRVTEVPLTRWIQNRAQNQIRGHFEDKWEYVGKFRSHARPIVGLHFTKQDDGSCRLFSVGHDSMIVEYDLIESVKEKRLKLKGTWPLNGMGLPETLHSTTAFQKGELHLLISDSTFKIRVYDTKNFVCHKTLLGPTFESPVDSMLRISLEPCIQEHLAFGTKNQILGVMILPLESNKNVQFMGVVGHAGSIQHMAMSDDRKFLMTVASQDG